MTSEDTPAGGTKSITTNLGGFNRKGLAREIFQGRVPDEFVRALPAQSLYMAIKHNGAESSADILEIASIDQFRLFVDFECWSRDQFSEESFWNWLRILSASDDLKLLQKFIGSIDLKLLAILISRYVQVCSFEEPTDSPPAPNWYTPDRGFTWLHFSTEESFKQFILGKLFAVLFETNQKLFYQILFVPNVSTDSMLEEEAYQDRCRRLSAEGIPTTEVAHMINRAISAEALLVELKQDPVKQSAIEIPVVDPLIYEAGGLEPLSSLAASVSNRDEFEGELTLIMNAAIVHYSVDFSEQDDVLALVSNVQGALNIGLERLHENSSYTLAEIYQKVGLQKPYRLGLATVMDLKKQALKISDEQLRSASKEAEVFSVIANLRENFPRMPLFLNPDGSISSEDGVLTAGHKAIETWREVNTLIKFLGLHFP